jgi:Nif-specific regulatory protein
MAGDFVEWIAVGDAEVPTDGRGRIFLNYYGPADAFPSYSAADVLRDAVPPAVFAGKVVLVGGTSTGVFDMRVSPFSPNLSSIAIQATCIENMLGRDWLTESTLSRVLTVAAIVFFGAVLGLLLPRLRSVLSGGLLFFACLASFALLNYWLFASRCVQASAVYPAVTIMAAYVAVSLCTNFARERKNARLRTTLGEVSETIDSVPDMEELLPGMLSSIVGFLGADRGVLMLQESDPRGERQLAGKAYAGITPEEWNGARRAFAREIARQAGREMRGVLVPDLRRKKVPGLDGVPGRPASVLCVPLKAKGRLAGVIYTEKGRGGGFDPDDLDIVGSFASQWAVAIENARLHGRLTQADARLREENLYPAKEVRQGERYTRLIGSSRAMQQLYALIEKAVDSDITVLIEGETGTGKELVARTIHHAGARKEGMFVAQNCAALPETLLESELFGHVKGAFTGATADKKGLFEVADAGTIFLDEIGEVPLGMQAKLLRVIAEGKIRPVGGLREKSVDVRIVSATNRDLAAEVREGRFREDLFYRLNVFPIRMPPLRDRREDVPSLALHFLEACAQRLRRQMKGFSAEAMDLLARYDYPGNVRELENEIERAVALSGDGEVITSEKLSEKFRAAGEVSPEAVEAAEEMALKDAVGNFERRLIRDALRRADGNKTLAAQRLGLTRQSLQHKIKLYHIEG